MQKLSLFSIRFFTLLAAISLLATSLFLGSCRKNTECTATVTVTDASTGLPVSGASVRLYASISKSGYSNIEQTVVTDAGGQAVFVFKLEGIFDIDITHTSKGTKTKLGVVKLESGKSVSKDVSY